MANNIRIALAASGLEHVPRGVETWTANTAQVLDRMGEEVTLFKGSGSRRRPYEAVCRCLRIAGAANRCLDKMIPPQAWHLGLGSRLKRQETTFALHLIPRLGWDYDIVHVKEPLVALLLQRAHKAGLVKAPVILGHGTEEPLWFLKKIDYVQHLAPHYLEEARRAGIDRAGWTAAGNFVDTEKFHPRGGERVRGKYEVEPGSFVVLCVAAVKRHHKRIGYLIQEVKKLEDATDRPVELVVIGASTKETPSLVEKAKRQLGENAHFLLDREAGEMPLLYALGDVFALCSLKEMFGTVILEAAASGLPCLVNNHPVVMEVAGAGGEAVQMEQEGALASALQKYMNEKYRRQKGQVARRHAVENFNKEVIVKKYLQMYRKVVCLDRQRRKP